MKTLLAYSSKTGNTKKVAEAVLKALPDGTDFLEVTQVKNLNDYEAVIVGFWVDKAFPNKEALEFIKTIRNKKTGYFFTLGAYINSEHAKDCHKNAVQLLSENGNTVLQGFCCQGKIDPALTQMFMSFPKGHPHYMDEERLKRHEEAAKHPDEDDLKKAYEAFKNFIQ